MDEKITAPKQTEVSLRQRIQEFSDLGRIRIVADFPSDIAYLQEKLFTGKKFLETYNCPKGVKDFVFDPSKRDGIKGHRALQFSVRVPFDGTSDFSILIKLAGGEQKGFLTETCDKNNKTQFITDASVTSATTADVKEFPAIQERLEEGKMKPEEHYADAGFVNGQTIVDSHDKGIALEGPSSGRSQSFEKYQDGESVFNFRGFSTGSLIKVDTGGCMPLNRIFICSGLAPGFT